MWALGKRWVIWALPLPFSVMCTLVLIQSGVKSVKVWPKVRARKLGFERGLRCEGHELLGENFISMTPFLMCKMGIVLVSWVTMTNEVTGWFKQHTFISHRSGSRKSETKVAAWWGSGKSIAGLQTADFFLPVASTWQKEVRELTGPLYKATVSTLRDSILMALLTYQSLSS